MTDETDDLKKRLLIDKHALDTELVEQASLYDWIGDLHADALAVRDALKEELATVDAQIDQELRATIEKLTEPRIKGLVQTDPRHKVAVDKYLRAKHKADRMQALEKAYDQRSTMLVNLGKLYLSNYYHADSVHSGPMARDRRLKSEEV